MDNMIRIISEINLLNDGDFENFNKLVFEGYNEIKNNDDIKKTCAYNSFLLAIDDYNAIIKDGKSFENKDYVNKLTEVHTVSVNGKEFFLSTDQLSVISKMKSGKNHVFSMPTSFGKSMLMRIFAKQMSDKNRRVIIITPTISLMNEYNILFDELDVVSSTSSASNKKVLILTQERAINIKFSKDDILLVDEAYVLAENDSRAGILYHVIYNAWKKEVSINMFLPNIRGVKTIFKKAFFSNLFEYVEIFKSLSTRTVKEPFKVKSRKEYIKDKVKNDGYKYCIFDQKRHIKNIPEILSSNSYKIPSPKSNILLNYLKKEFGEQYGLLAALKKGIVISHGSIPKQFRFISELMYKRGEVNIIASTGTLTKGVNMHPDKIIIMSNNFFMNSYSDNFELRNAIGRAGRYTKDVTKRIGDVFLAGTPKQYNSFKENFNNFTRDYIEAEWIQQISTPDKTVSDFDFNAKENIDWIHNKFGVKEEEIIRMVDLNRKIFEEYINYKYFEKSKNNLTSFDNVWKTIIDNNELIKRIIKLFIKDFEEPNEKIINYYLNSAKYQGFNESLKPIRTYIESAMSEMKKLKKRKDKLFTNFSTISSYKKNDNFKEINDLFTFKDDNLFLDLLIERKSDINSKFMESFLNPLDAIIAKHLGKPLDEVSEIDEALEDHNIPSEFRKVLTDKLETNKEYSKENYYDIIKKDSFFKSILSFIITK